MRGSLRCLAGAVTLAAVSACATSAQHRTGLPSALEAGWNGAQVCEELHRTDTHRTLKCSFAPGVGHERHFHPAHFGYALSGGTMRLTDARGDRIAKIATGSSYSSDGVEWHQVVNVGDTTVTYLIVEQL